MKKTGFLFLAIVCSLSLRAQEEYRISQPLPDSVNYRIAVPAGCDVRIVTADHAGVSIINSPQSFFVGGSELQVLTVDKEELSIETYMPAIPMVVEIAVKEPLRGLTVKKGGRVTTGDLEFVPGGSVTLEEGSWVQGATWSGLSNLDVQVFYDARLQLDTLKVRGRLDLYRAPGATVNCAAVEGTEGELTLDRRSFGTDFGALAPENFTVKQVSHSWRRHFNQAELSFGFSAPLTVCRNNRYGSAYNIDQSISLNMLVSTNDIRLSDRWSMRTGFLLEERWSRLLNHVATDGSQLTVVTPTSGLLPRQTLNQTLLGLNLGFTYGIGPYDTEKRHYPLSAQFGMSFLYSAKGQLLTRTQGTDNRWHREKEAADVFNPWQIRANMGLLMGPTLGCRVDFFVDLLPTFRSGIGADKMHCMGISIGF